MTRNALVGLNLALGPAVLASYVWGAMTYPEQMMALWGGVPDAVRSAYTTNMFLAAAGYLVFTWRLVLKTDLETARFFGGRIGASALVFAYAAILVGSVAWMPLSLHALDAHLPALVPVIVADLWLVATGALVVLGCVASLHPRPSATGRVAAIVGALFFVVQTVILDATVWPLFFEVAPT